MSIFLFYYHYHNHPSSGPQQRRTAFRKWYQEVVIAGKYGFSTLASTVYEFGTLYKSIL